MIVQHVLLNNGDEIFLRGSGQPRWPDASQIVLKGGIDSNKAASAKADGIFRVWTWGRFTPGWWFFGDNDNFSLTDSAIEQHESWN